MEPAASTDITGALFVANKEGNSLSKVSLESGEEVKRVGSCANPHELATSPDDEYVALACYGGTSLDIFRTGDLERVASVELGDNALPHGIVWHENGSLYATAEGRRSMFWVKDPVGDKPEVFEYSTNKAGSHMLAVSPDARHAWTMDLGSGTVTMVDLITRRAPRSVEVGVEPEGIDLSPDGKTLWVSARGSDKAIELDPMTLEIKREVDVGRFPLRLAIHPSGKWAVTSDYVDGGLSVIDTESATMTRSIPVSGGQAARQVTILFSPDGERIYVAEVGNDKVAEVDFVSGKVLRRLPTGDGGDGLAIID